MKPCLRPGCKQRAASRGLCQSCYGYARTLVERGSTTWDDLVARGRVLAIVRKTGAGRPRDPKLIEWFSGGA